MPLLKPETKVDGNKYRIMEYLGEGPWGEEYRVERLEDQRLAVMVMATRFKKHGELLAQTARALHGVVHKNLCEILDVGYADPTRTTVYWTREWVDGMDFETLVHQRFPLGANLGFVRRFVYHIKGLLCDMHESFYHGRLTPRMVWLTSVGRVKVTDPGFLPALRTKVPSVAILLPGEAPFVAPELRGRGQGSTKSDVYSFAALVHLLISGQPPGEAGEIHLKPSVPQEVVQVIRDGLAQNPDDRPDAASFGDRLYGILSSAPEKATVSSMMMDLLQSFEGADTGRKYMVQKDRLDYGPYDGAQIRELVVEESILPHHLVVSMDTGERYRLSEHPDFADFLREYQRQKELERREQAEQEVQKLEKRQSRILKLSVILGAVIIAVLGLSFMVYKAVGGGGTSRRKALQLADADIDVKEDSEGVGRKIRRKHRRKRHGRRHSRGGSGSAGKKIESYSLDGVQLSKYEILGVINSSGVMNKIAANCSLPAKGRIVITYQIAGRSGKVAYVSARVDGKVDKRIARCAYRYLHRLQFPKRNTDLSGTGHISY